MGPYSCGHSTYELRTNSGESVRSWQAARTNYGPRGELGCGQVHLRDELRTDSGEFVRSPYAARTNPQGAKA